MKNLVSILSAALIGFACSFAIISCEENRDHKDSAAIAEDENDRKFETKESEKNAELVAKSVEHAYAVIELSKLAAEKALSKDVKEIALLIQKDHEAILVDLKAVAEKEGISIANGPTDKAEEKVEDLSEKDADKFDKKYVNKMIDKHKKGISELEDALESEDIHAIEKEWANKTLPSLRTHLNKLEEIEKLMKN
jgi:putative membrane protein